MNKILFFFITLFFAASAAAAEKGRATYFDQMALGARAEVIVEFRGVPAALEQGETARARGEAATARAELFARFRRDLGGLQLRDATGTLADVLRRGESATLHLSIADYVYDIGDVRTTPARSDATRVLYRLEGGSQWLPLTVQPAGTDYGSRPNLRRLPVGEMYTIDLGAVTAAVGTFDLRFEAADQAGNAVTWTVERAFIVSDAQRRPAVGR